MFFYWLLWVEALGAVLRVTLFAAQSFIKLPRNKALDGGEPYMLVIFTCGKRG